MSCSWVEYTIHNSLDIAKSKRPINRPIGCIMRIAFRSFFYGCVYDIGRIKNVFPEKVSLSWCDFQNVQWTYFFFEKARDDVSTFACYIHDYINATYVSNKMYDKVRQTQ